MNTLMQASAQWSSRPFDERFASLIDLHEHTSRLRNKSMGKVVSSRALSFQPKAGHERTHLEVVGQNGSPAEPTNWAFGQLAALAGAPAGYLRKLPPALVADNLNYGMRFDRDVEDVGILLTRDGGVTDMRAATGPRYGRIWNSEITASLVNRFGDGVTGDWKVPGEFGKDVPITKANTTLYASDRDMFVFLADEHNRIEMPNRRNGQSGSLARGFFVWNSEVGSQSIGAAFFLFDFVCCNRIVWGAEGYKEFRLRHTVSAPDKWLEQISPVLVEYANSKTATVQDALVAAQAKKLDDVDAFLKTRFSAKDASLYKQAHEREEGRPIETVWDVVTGMTAHAKTIGFQDDRVALERAAGKVLDLVAA